MIIPVDYAQANLRFTGPGVPTGAEMTIGLDVSIFAGSPSAAATAVAGDWASAGCQSLMTNKGTLSEVEVKFGPNATGPTGIWTGNLVGSVSAESVAPNTSVLITKLTAFGGRAGKGRMFMPAVAESEVTSGGQLTGPYISAANVAMTAFLAALVADDLQPVLLHNVGSPIVIPTNITSLVCGQQVATQRRRNRR